MMFVSKWYRKVFDIVFVEEWMNCKNLVYGLLYGSGVKKLVFDLCMCEEVVKFEVVWFKFMFLCLMEWLDGIVICVWEEKLIVRVTIISVRYRYFLDLYLKNNDDRVVVEW